MKTLEFNDVTDFARRLREQDEAEKQRLATLAANENSGTAESLAAVLLDTASGAAGNVFDALGSVAGAVADAAAAVASAVTD